MVLNFTVAFCIHHLYLQNGILSIPSSISETIRSRKEPFLLSKEVGAWREFRNSMVCQESLDQVRCIFDAPAWCWNLRQMNLTNCFTLRITNLWQNLMQYLCWIRSVIWEKWKSDEHIWQHLTRHPACNDWLTGNRKKFKSAH